VTLGDATAVVSRDRAVDRTKSYRSTRVCSRFGDESAELTKEVVAGDVVLQCITLYIDSATIH
jgi:hypothetical protein